MDISQLVTLNEAAAMAEMSPELFRYYMDSGRAPKAIPLGDRLFFDRRDIKGWKPKPKPLGRRKKVTKLPPAYAAGTEPRITAKPKDRKGEHDAG